MEKAQLILNVSFKFRIVPRRYLLKLGNEEEVRCIETFPSMGFGILSLIYGILQLHLKFIYLWA